MIAFSAVVRRKPPVEETDNLSPLHLIDAWIALPQTRVLGNAKA
jgi:hypothetical protein